MKAEPELPAIDSKALARAFLRSAQPAGSSQSKQLAVRAEQLRLLASKSMRLAWLTLPICVLIGATAVFISPNLAIIPVLCGSLAYARFTVALRERKLARDAADLALRWQTLEFASEDGSSRGRE